MSEPILRVALDAPVMQAFDYLPPPGDVPLRPGQRVAVPFRSGERVGVILSLSEDSRLPRDRLRRARACLDPEPLLDAGLMALLDWAAAYYQHPPGEVYAAALPKLLRRGRSPRAATQAWRATSAAVAALTGGALARAPAQARVLTALVASPWGLAADDLRALGVATGSSGALQALVARGLVERIDATGAAPAPHATPAAAPVLTEPQRAAVEEITRNEGYGVFLLEGVTGSGKTEVYLQSVAAELRLGRQALLLVPEIGLTPQLLDRIRARFPAAGLAVMHSALSDGQRLDAWQRARRGDARIVVGTRSAVFTPLASPGLIIVDEEHDSSFKQHEGFRYSARDIAVWRARQLGITAVLGSATPSFETLFNAASGRYRKLVLPERPGAARHPTVHLIDLRRYPAVDGLSQPLLAAIGRHLGEGGQVLLYLNRRGFAPTLFCPGCGGTIECQRCDARLVLHQERNRMICHHCGAERPVPAQCAHCAGTLYPIGQGTERLEQALRGQFPDAPAVRLDRDTTRRRGELEERLERVASGRARILLGTRMLTKGHDFPGVTLVGIIDADQGLFGTDFRASERLAQSFVQVAGRAGRGDKPGEVHVQTLFPEHPLLRLLVQGGYEQFAREALLEREAAAWPPYSHLALLRAEASRPETAQAFLAAARAKAETLDLSGITLLGPAPASMERRAGRFRAQLLVQSPKRPALQRLLAGWRPLLAELREARGARWSLDIDPIDSD
jgi:primosomal protein N' (replication factor Y)